MRTEELLELYIKERDYQTTVFGDYSKNPAFNFGTFIIFLDQYLDRIKKSYLNKWDKELPEWMITSQEFIQQKSAPVEAYENLIKLMTLAGATLENYTDINVDNWRAEGINSKWTN